MSTNVAGRGIIFKTVIVFIAALTTATLILTSDTSRLILTGYSPLLRLAWLRNRDVRLRGRSGM